MSDKYLDYFVHGWSLYMRFNKAANAEAREEYKNSIAENPNFCRAYADLAYSILHAWLFNWDKTVSLQDAKDVLAKAPKACEDDYYFLWVKGALHLYSRDFVNATALYQRSWNMAQSVAIPSDLDALKVDRAEMLLLTGNAKQAIADIEAVLGNKKKVHEKWFYWVLSWAYYADGQWQKAIDAIDKNIRHRRNAIRLTVAASLAALGKNAAAEAQSFIDDEGKQSITYTGLKEFLDLEDRVPFSNSKQAALWREHLAKAFDTVLPKP
jgi:predicted Zn-dependent protease